MHQVDLLTLDDLVNLHHLLDLVGQDYQLDQWHLVDLQDLLDLVRLLYHLDLGNLSYLMVQ